MKLAVMQPYVFPYIGYFQLIEAVDTFVFYDDVNFIKGGWVNRNTILVNNKKYLFTIPLSNISSFNLISETEIHQKSVNIFYKKFLKTIEQSYKKAPFFDEIFKLISELLIQDKYLNISQLAIDSVMLISNYLNIKTNFKISSVDFKEFNQLERIERLIEICMKEKANHYINSIGGVELYDASFFKKQNIELNFIKAKPIAYKQFDNEFIPRLSILDVLMFNSKSDIKNMLLDYELI